MGLELGAGMSRAQAERMSPDSLVSGLASAVKAEIYAEIMSAVVQEVRSALINLHVEPTISLSPRVQLGAIDVAAPEVTVENNINLDALGRKMDVLAGSVGDLIRTLNAPMQRTVTRDGNGRILTITDRRM